MALDSSRSLGRKRSSHSIPTTLPWRILLFSWLASMTAAYQASDFFVHSLPGQPEGPLLKMHAGHIEVNSEHNGNLFFWHFQNRHIANRQRTVIWLNGGPGCSSEDGALMEIGPYRVKDKDHLMYNEGSWDEFANLLFIDNPIGTGFSYANSDSYLHELKEMADQMIIFLEKFFETFPEYESDDLYIAGESYAGQHIPYIARAILDRNKATTTHQKWNLQGLLIGNGWISPEEQSYAFLAKSYDYGLVQRGSDVASQLEAQQSKCKQAIEQGGKYNHVDFSECEQILSKILDLTQKNGRCPNMYDLRLDDKYPSCGMNWPPDLKALTPYLRRNDVKMALNVNKDKSSGWTECAGAVSGAFRAKNSKPSITLLPDLLDEVSILLFSGDQDLICSHVGTEELINNMSWKGGKGFEISPSVWAPRRDWTFEGEAAGFWQSARNLTYVLFYNSSHMVPFDYPRRTRNMLDRFMGVDIASIGGVPADSRIDGEKGIETSVGGHPNSTIAQQEQDEAIDEAKWSAYYRSGAIALVIVIILASMWALFVWRERRKRTGYQSVFGDNGSSARMMRSGMRRDVEAGDFDESELDDLHVVDADEADEHEGGAGKYEAGKYSDGNLSMNGHGKESKKEGDGQNGYGRKG
ncbi:Cell death protease [Agyrium rufum]|nr:Cell death protease [Agyrium rufum]